MERELCEGDRRNGRVLVGASFAEQEDKVLGWVMKWILQCLQIEEYEVVKNLVVAPLHTAPSNLEAGTYSRAHGRMHTSSA